MKKILLALTATLFSTPVFAGAYINVETNSSSIGSDYQGRATDLHIGWEGDVGKLGYYIQGGPVFNSVDGADGDTQISGKLGGNVGVTDKLDVYGEFSLVTADATDNSYGTKLGVKYSF